MAAFVAKQMLGSKMNAVKGKFYFIKIKMKYNF